MVYPSNGNTSFIADIYFDGPPLGESEVSFLFRINSTNGSELDTWLQNHEEEIIDFVILDPTDVIYWETGNRSTLTSTAEVS